MQPQLGRFCALCVYISPLATALVCTTPPPPAQLPSKLTEMMEECWDGDAEARLSAANVVMRMEEVMEAKLPDHDGHDAWDELAAGEGSHTSDTDSQRPAAAAALGGVSQSGAETERTVGAEVVGDGGRVPDLEGSMPPPYSELPALPELSSGLATSQRLFFQSSMPHISDGEPGGRYGYTRPPSSHAHHRQLRNSAVLEREVGVAERSSVSVRNSLILGGVSGMPLLPLLPHPLPSPDSRPPPLDAPRPLTPDQTPPSQLSDTLISHPMGQGLKQEGVEPVGHMTEGHHKDTVTGDGPEGCQGNGIWLHNTTPRTNAVKLTEV